MSVLSVTALNQFYGGSHTLWDVNLDVPAGSRTCLMGRNGMGKTTLLKCIMGLLPAASGEIVFDGSDLRAQPPEARARLGIGYVPQGREIFPQLTVEENLQVGVGMLRSSQTGRTTARTFRRGSSILFPVLKTMRHRRGGDLSGGQQQQLAIGRALVLEPIAADSGRADRRYSAEHRARDRRHHSEAERGDGPHGAAGRAEVTVRAPRRQ